MSTKPRFAVIDLNGQPCERYTTREHAAIAVTRLASGVNYSTQDKSDEEFCKRYGVPFQPRRFFFVNTDQHHDIR